MPSPSGPDATVGPHSARGRAPTSRLALLAQAGAALARAAPLDEALPEMAGRLVPGLGDLCLIEWLDEGALFPVAVVHGDPARRVALQQILSAYPHSPDGAQPGPTAVRTGRPVVVRAVTEAWLAQCTHGEDHLRRAVTLGVGSVMAVPLLAGGRTLGAITLALADGGRRYGRRDLAAAEALAALAAAALDAGRLRQHRLEAQAGADTLLAHCPLALVVLDRDLRFTYANEAAAVLNGVPVSEIVGHTYEQAFPWMAAQIVPIVHRVLQTGMPALDVAVSADTDQIADAHRHRRASYYPVRDAGGRISGVAVVVANVTGSLRRAMERERLLGQLQTERELLQAVIDQMPAGVGIVQASAQNPLRCNARLTRIWPDLAAASPSTVGCRRPSRGARSSRSRRSPSGIRAATLGFCA